MFGRNPILPGRKVFVLIEVRRSGVRAGGHGDMQLPWAYCVGFSAAVSPSFVGGRNESMGGPCAARAQATLGALGKTPSLRRLRPLAAGVLRARKDVPCTHTLIPKDSVGLVTIK